jgi:hypothetical protein
MGLERAVLFAVRAIAAGRSCFFHELGIGLTPRARLGLV